jgi:putative ABC transport system permease protein
VSFATVRPRAAAPRYPRCAGDQVDARRAGLWLRWSWRDLRQRWLLVTAIAAIIALGTGATAGLGSTAAWRRQSNDESFGQLRMHDLRVTLPQGATVAAGSLAARVLELPHADLVEGIEERLVGPTQVDASTAEATVLVPGQVVGVDVAGGPLVVDALHAFGGRVLQQEDDGAFVGMLEHQFADHYGLPATGRLQLSGGVGLAYVGVGTAPEYFVVTSRTASVFAQASFAVIFVPLTTAQQLLGQDGMVNEVVLRLTPGADRAAVDAELRAALGEASVGASITVREDEAAWRMLYQDIEGDQQFWNIIAGLILLGASFAAFNLVTRIVEAQRREIGIGMALGVPSPQLAIRPLLVGAQIAVFGAIAGLAIGGLLDLWLANVFQSVLPMPVFHAPFQLGVFARAAAIGVALPFLATAIPVWRAVRVQPVDAIRTGHLAASGPARGLRLRRRSPGRSYRRLPVRNLVRTPRRTLLTAMAIGAAITTLVATIGLIDSFVRTMDDAEAELVRGGTGRLQVELDGFYAADSPEVSAIGQLPVVDRVDVALRLIGRVTVGTTEIDVVTDLIDVATAAWTPTMREGRLEDMRDGGIVLSEKAAADLGVHAGDIVAFHHPQRDGLTYRMVESATLVAGVHPSPMRFAAYLDLGQAEQFGVAGLTNLVEIVPAAGATEAEVQRAVFGLPGVGSVQPVAAFARLFEDAMEDYFGVLRVAELIVLVLALLIAFNATSISVDERRREHATMMAFGLPPGTVLALTAVETVLLGALGTIIGLVSGRLVLGWMLRSQLDKTLPELGVHAYVSTATTLTAIAVGVIAVALAPLLTARRVRGIDIPATLRVVE